MPLQMRAMQDHFCLFSPGNIEHKRAATPLHEHQSALSISLEAYTLA